jgi:hypothetical protein
MRNLLCAAVAIALLNFPADSKEPPGRVDPWASYRFLLGEWVGEGDGQPGQGKGQFSFAEELQGKILVRKNRAEYPAGAGRLAFTHEDLLIVYHDDGAKAAKAIYFDSEGHVIQYTPSTSQDGKALIFLSDARPAAPRYRLTYVNQEDSKATVQFEVAPPGKPEAFKTYLQGRIRKK